MVKGPYLQALGATSVEVRAELDTAGPVVVTIVPFASFATPPPDGAAPVPLPSLPPRPVRDDAVQTMHVVRIEGLAPATRYAYSFTAGIAPPSKGELTTAPAPDAAAPFTFLVYGDNRTDDTAHAAIVRAMLQSPSDFLLNTGDLVQDGASQANWESFFAIEAPLLRDRNAFACVGNHEITDGAGASYLRYFGPTSDAHGEGEPPKLYGSFRWGSARFFLLDAMDAFASDPERAWLDDELARADSEAGLVWRIVVMHHGPWSSGPHGGNARALRAGIPALLVTHHVDLVLAGHDHIYERGAASGLRYVISGGGGAPLYEIENRLPSARKAESVHHFIEATVSGDAFRLVTKRSDGSVLERCGFTKAQGQERWDCDAVSTGPLHVDPPATAAPSASTRCGCLVVGAGGARAEGSLAFAFGALAVAGARRRALSHTRARRRGKARPAS